MEPFIGFMTMLLVISGYNIVECCGAGMLWTMWSQLSMLETGWCNTSEGGCEEMIASLEAEANGCLGCGPHADG